MSALYQWEGNYKLVDCGIEVLLEIGYSWGDPATGIGAGIEKINAFDAEGKEVHLTDRQVEAIQSDNILCERIEDYARDQYVAYLENRSYDR